MISLARFNPHWQEGFFYNIQIERDFVNLLKKELDNRLILGIFGLRRVGKTTGLKQLIDYLIKKGVKRKNILFYSFDDSDEIMDVIERYESVIGKTLSQDYILIFDEINYAKNWKSQLKVIYDLYKPKIFISGSQSALIKKEMISLAGRIKELIVNPLTFKEFLRFKKREYLFNTPEAKDEFSKYLKRQFPEVLFMEIENAESYYQSIYKKVIYEDIPKIFNIKEGSIIESVFNVIKEKPGILLSLNEFSKEFGINRNKLSLIINALESAFLIKKIYNFSTNKITSEKKLKKFYTLPSFTSLGEDLLVESYIAMLPNIKFFWRSKSKNEVDFIYKNYAVEVKYRNVILKKDLRGLISFTGKYKDFSPAVIKKANSKIVPKEINNKEILYLNPWDFESRILNTR